MAMVSRIKAHEAHKLVVSAGMLPQENFRPSEVVSDTILG